MPGRPLLEWHVILCALLLGCVAFYGLLQNVKSPVLAFLGAGAFGMVAIGVGLRQGSGQ